MCCMAVGNSINTAVKKYASDISSDEIGKYLANDTISIMFIDGGDIPLHIFTYENPDTIWLKARTQYPQIHKHIELVTAYKGIKDVGINAHRQYTLSSSLENVRFIVLDEIKEDIPYLGTTLYLRIKEVETNRIVKWNIKNKENNNIVVFDYSRVNRLKRIIGRECLIHINDSIIVQAKCVKVNYMVDVKPTKWVPNVSFDFVDSINNRYTSNCDDYPFDVIK